MHHLTWSPNEKQIARAAFGRAAAAEEKELLERVKARVAALEVLDDLWALQYAIRDWEREYQQKYDFRYSQLIFVFGRLVREDRISIDEMEGLGDEKMALIERIASLGR